ncbi:DUF397 domain-containing protein [Kitasatospora sp. NPDC094028]
MTKDLSHLDWQKPSGVDENTPNYLEIASEGDNVYIRENTNPDLVVTTTRRKLDAWIKGAKAGEFDHFIA